MAAWVSKWLVLVRFRPELGLEDMGDGYVMNRYSMSSLNIHAELIQCSLNTYLVLAGRSLIAHVALVLDTLQAPSSRYAINSRYCVSIPKCLS